MIMNKGFLLLSGLGVGAGLSYLLDPSQGPRRRSRIRANVRRAGYQAADLLNDGAGSMWDHTRDAFDQVQAHLPARYWPRSAAVRRRHSLMPDDMGLLLLGGLGLGAGLLLFFGARKASPYDVTSSKPVAQLRHWVDGFMDECMTRIRRKPVSDRELVTQVQDRLEDVVSRPKAINVTANQGMVTLRGHVLAREYDDMMSSVSSLHGVHEVIDRLEVEEQSATIMGVEERSV